MKAEEKTHSDLIKELAELRRKVAELEKSESVYRQAEESLKQEQEKFRIMAEKSPLGISIIGKDGRYQYLNPKFIEVFGYTLEDIPTGEDWFKKAYPDPVYRRWVVATWLKDLKEGRPGETRPQIFTVSCKEGREKIIYFRPVTMETGDQLVIYEDITAWKKAEEALQESEAKFRAIIEHLPQRIFLKDRDSVYITCNRNLSQDMGIVVEAISGKTDFEFFPPELAEKYRADDQRVITSGSILTFDEKYISSGRESWVHTTKAPYRDQKGNIIGVIGVFEDITENKRAQETLQESEERFRRVFEGSPLGMCMASPDFRFTKVNEAFCRMLGYTEQELTSLTFKDITHPEHLAQDADSVEKLTAGEIPVYRTEKRYLHKRGQIVWAVTTVTAMKDQAGRILYFLSLIEDITERKHTEEALRESEDRYRDLVESSRDLICTHDLNGQILWVNAEPLRILGYDRELVLKMNLRDILVPERKDEFDDYLATIKSQGTASGLMAIQTAKGEKRIWEYHNTLRTEGVSHPIVRGMAHDVTDRERAQKEKARLESELLQSQKMEAIGTLAGGIAHDFNNLLTSIIGYGNLLQMDMDDDDPRKLYLNQILTASEKAASLTQSLLAFSRKQVMELKPRALNPILKGIEKLLKRLLTEDIEFQVVPADPDVTVKVDVNQIDQVLMNLITNARDAMPKGGKLRLEAKVVQLGEQFIRMHGYGEPGPYALISVTDTGGGMDEATREKIFDPFFTTKEVGKGTGLGLSIVYGIVKQHNGYIQVDSHLHRGTMVAIYLPIVKALEEKLESIVENWKSGTETILVTEDNHVVRNLIREVLTLKGYTVIEAVDGEEAVQKFMEHKEAIDLLLLDVVMPKKNGMEVYEQIKRIKPKIKVLFTSGYTGDVIFSKGIHDDALDFISKPLSPMDLLLKIRKVLDQ